jgi:hypothetical protein
MSCHGDIAAFPGPVGQKVSQQKLGSFERENPCVYSCNLLGPEMITICLRNEKPEKFLAICNEKSSFIIDGCNIFMIINHKFLTCLHC